MKELLKDYMSKESEFKATTKKVNECFSKFIQGIPRWREFMDNIIRLQGERGFDDDLIEDLIPEVIDLQYHSESNRVSFKIRIPSDTWQRKWIEIHPISLDILTTGNIPKDYISRRIKSLEDYLGRLGREQNDLISEMEKVERDIEELRRLM